MWVTGLQHTHKQLPFGSKGSQSKFAMVTNWSDKRSGYLAEQRDANSSVSTGSTDACLIKFCYGEKVAWKKMEICWKCSCNSIQEFSCCSHRKGVEQVLASESLNLTLSYLMFTALLQKGTPNPYPQKLSAFQGLHVIFVNNNDRRCMSVTS